MTAFFIILIGYTSVNRSESVAPSGDIFRYDFNCRESRCGNTKKSKSEILRRFADALAAGGPYLDFVWGRRERFDKRIVPSSELDTCRERFKATSIGTGLCQLFKLSFRV
jgi:hypothetical protein